MTASSTLLLGAFKLLLLGVSSRDIDDVCRGKASAVVDEVSEVSVETTASVGGAVYLELGFI